MLAGLCDGCGWSPQRCTGATAKCRSSALLAAAARERESWAEVFSRVHRETGSLLEALDAYYEARRGCWDTSPGGIVDLVATVADLYVTRPRMIIGWSHEPKRVDEARQLVWYVLDQRALDQRKIAETFGRTPRAITKGLTMFRRRLAQKPELQPRADWLLGRSAGFATVAAEREAA